MHAPRLLARFNRRVTNPLQRLWAGRLRSHAIIEHVGRKSGRVYRTPVLVFPTADGFAFLIGYGRESDWVRNLVARNRGAVVNHGRRYEVDDVQVHLAPEGRQFLPTGLGRFTALLGEGHVLTVRRVPGGESDA
jgi:deazaflavin-dependent oxidoreductase (nitroreductase family)